MGQFGIFVCDNRLSVPTWALIEAQPESLTETLNEPEAFSFSIPQDAPNVRQIDGIRREIQVREYFQDGTNVVSFQGTVMKESGDQNIATFECQGLLALIGRRYVDDASITFTSVDQLLIGWQLIAAAQSEATQAWRDFNIDAATFSNSGKVRSRTYNRTEHQNYLDLLAEFPKLDDGFDYSIAVQPDGARWWTPHYPRKGSFKPELTIQYDSGGARSMSSFDYSRDWQKLTTHAYCTGGTTGEVKFEENYEDTASSAYWKAVLQTIVSEGSQKDVVWLLEKATKTVIDRRQPIFQPTITTTRVPRDMWGLLNVGDTIPLIIDRGRILLAASKRIVQKKLIFSTDIVELTFESDDEAG